MNLWHHQCIQSQALECILAQESVPLLMTASNVLVLVDTAHPGPSKHPDDPCRVFALSWLLGNLSIQDLRLGQSVLHLGWDICKVLSYSTIFQDEYCFIGTFALLALFQLNSSQIMYSRKLGFGSMVPPKMEVCIQWKWATYKSGYKCLKL